MSPFKRHGSQTSKPGPHRSTLRETVGQAKVSSQYSRHRLNAYALFLVCASASLEPALAEPLSQWIPRNVDAISIYVWSGADDRAVPNYAAIDRLKMTKDVEEKVLSMLERSAQSPNEISRNDIATSYRRYGRGTGKLILDISVRMEAESDQPLEQGINGVLVSYAIVLRLHPGQWSAGDRGYYTGDRGYRVILLGARAVTSTSRPLAEQIDDAVSPGLAEVVAVLRQAS